MSRLLTVSRGIAQSPELTQLLQGCRVKYHGLTAGFSQRKNIKAVLGWGRKPNTQKAEHLAARLQRPLWRLEDGFISYLGHPALGDRRFSLIVDKTGIYYDATTPSDLENLLNQPDWLTPELEARAGALIARVREHRISKYNHEPLGPSPQLMESSSPHKPSNKVLVVDQTFGDCSITFGMADKSSFDRMLQAALEENPESEIWVKVHPDVVLGRKKGYFDDLVHNQLEHRQTLKNQNPLPTGQEHSQKLSEKDKSRIRILSDQVNAQSLFNCFQSVYVVTSQLGFEALLHQCPVVCFGVPFYSGWGLTDDRTSCQRRQQKHTIERLFTAACLKYTRYIDPETGAACQLEALVELIALQRQYQHPEVDTLYAVGFSLWKRAFIRQFVGGMARQLVFVRQPNAYSARKTLKKRLSRTATAGTDAHSERKGLLIWGRKSLPEGIDREATPVWRMEDGFIRSCGLGADLRRPASLVLDNRGIYYDSTCTSGLEHALEHLPVNEIQTQRGAGLIQALLRQRITKYNLGSSGEQPDPVFAGATKNQRRILIAGQVDSDASLRYGSPVIHNNLELLRQVRHYINEHNLDAYIVYKPHPDVVQAGRQGHIPEADVLQYADRQVTTADIFDCIAQSDDVHVMSSQAGFEALLQHKQVHCWGLPFYAGWGLTHDHCSNSRRTRQRSLEALVFIALCHYPRYVHWQTRRFTTPERIINELARQRANPVNSPVRSSRFNNWFGRKARKARFLLEALTQ